MNKNYQYTFKSFFDFLISFFLLILLFFPFVFIAFLIINDSRGKVFFKQKRFGLNGKLFEIYKFRTMVANAQEIGGYSTKVNDNRITRIGRVLRKTSIDELPQLINILKGEMSFYWT